MTKLNEKRDELCVETENADEQKGFVMGWDAAIAEVMPQVQKLVDALKYISMPNSVHLDNLSRMKCAHEAITEWQEYVREK